MPFVLLFYLVKISLFLLAGLLAELLATFLRSEGGKLSFCLSFFRPSLFFCFLSLLALCLICLLCVLVFFLAILPPLLLSTFRVCNVYSYLSSHLACNFTHFHFPLSAMLIFLLCSLWSSFLFTGFLSFSYTFSLFLVPFVAVHYYSIFDTLLFVFLPSLLIFFFLSLLASFMNNSLAVVLAVLLRFPANFPACYVWFMLRFPLPSFPFV